MKLVIDDLETPIGRLFLACDDARLKSVGFGNPPEGERRQDPHGFTSRLRAFFKGDLAAIDDLPCDGEGTPFQRAVWSALRKIPCGSTVSYGELARRLGKPGASRAVGLANGQNPIPIVVPCHRVIGSDGSLTGYGGGLDRKRWLLHHEGALLT